MSRGRTIAGGWSGDKCDARGDDGVSGGVTEEGIDYIDVSMSRKDPLAWVGRVKWISLAPVEKTQLKQGCPFDGPDQGLPDRAMNDSSAIRANDAVNGYANSSWSWNDRLVEEASCGGRGEEKIGSDLNLKNPLRSAAVLQF